MQAVKAWKDRIVIPTYEVGEPEKYPVFLEKRVYQASSGAVYPHPVIEHISDEKVDKEWDVVYIENEFIKIMVLPALGGRIQMAYDKVRQRHFVYYNHVIKPALVGLTGPWISGGIEFNWPQHHRPSTYDPVDYSIEAHEDGSQTVWVSEVERMFRTKGMAGFRLYPDKAYLEINVKLYNRTPHPQTFLWWANPAVAVNADYQSVFPPDVNAVFDHGKRDVSEFPIAKGTYYKVDYAPGTDISRYKNIPVPTSYMAITSEHDFVGGYENDSEGGLLHVANHHVSPGKKQWTWGNGDFGQAWDRNLTDSDGPYIELMCGVFTDNQPDFSWLQPYEEKQFTQYFMPYYKAGVVKNATKNALVNFEELGDRARLVVYSTGAYAGATVRVERDGLVHWERTVDLEPATAFETELPIAGAGGGRFSVTVTSAEGRELVAWSAAPDEVEADIPEAARAAKRPEDIEHIEQLYLRGLHLEQYRHATYNPTDYYLEGLKRDPGDVRNNNAMGLYLLRRGRFERALAYFDRAIGTLTERNPNPYDGEPYYNRGLALRYLGRPKEAYDAFFKSTWNAAWQSAGFFQLAQLDTAAGEFERALDLVDKSLVRNWHHHKARHLKVLLLRHLGREGAARQLIDDSLALDHFNFGVWYEKYLLGSQPEDLETLQGLLRGYVHNYLEFALDYTQAGRYGEAVSLLLTHANGQEEVYPMAAYLLSWAYRKLGDGGSADQWAAKARRQSMDYCFPNRLEEIILLQSALEHAPEDARANYYLGNFWYANRQYDLAQSTWERACELDNSNPICLRNLALLYYNKRGEKQRATHLLEEAFRKDPENPRLLMELDQLYKKENAPPAERLARLENHLELTRSRDDLYLERVTLYNVLGQYAKARNLVLSRQFHPWEGGEGKVPFQYLTASIELAKTHYRAGSYQQAIELLTAARSYPDNLGEGRLQGTPENDINYWLGCTYAKLGMMDVAREHWELATTGSAEPGLALFYNDQQPDNILYQGLALIQLGRQAEAKDRFQALIDYGRQHENDEVQLDYFAVSLPDLLIWEEDLGVRNAIHCAYLIGLGNLGLGHLDEARRAFGRVLDRQGHHLPALLHLNYARHLVEPSPRQLA